jgi:hypothetical protein
LEIFRRVYLNHQEVYESLDEESNWRSGRTSCSSNIE